MHAGGNLYCVVGLGVALVTDTIAKGIGEQNAALDGGLKIFAIGFAVVVAEHGVPRPRRRRHGAHQRRRAPRAAWNAGAAARCRRRSRPGTAAASIPATWTGADSGRAPPGAVATTALPPGPLSPPHPVPLPAPRRPTVMLSNQPNVHG
jgi:hypothetical protein